ncbi:MAG: periplasmic heavy metal sensor [Chitinophagaceae bacterium]|nr:periplasmic heavy metal sensor [Chitinophagaceae bacterium]
MSTGARNNKALIGLVIILLLSNLAVLLYFTVWNRRPEHKGGKGDFSIVDYMKKEVGFNEEQTKQFQQLHEQNRDSLKLIGDSIRSSKNSLYRLLREPANDSSVAQAINTLSVQQQRMELTMFRHFGRVRSICNPEQKVKLDSMVNRMNNKPAFYRRNGNQRTEGQKKNS